MSDVQTLRPVTTADSDGWVAEPSGTLHGVTSDDSDATWADLPSPGGGVRTMEFGTGTHTPPADHQRHRVRLRVRARAPLSNYSLLFGIDLTPIFVDAGQVSVTDAAFSERIGSWKSAPSGPPPPGDPIPLTRIGVGTTGTASAEVAEVYFDIDSRAKPAFTADVLDASDTSQAGGTITDTTVPRFVFDTLTLDGLPARRWQVWVYTLAQTMAGGFEPFVTAPVTSREGTGAPPSTIAVDPLVDDDYVAYMQAFSTIRSDDAFASDIETVAFEMAVEAPPEPDVTVTPNANPPSVEVCWAPPPPEVGDVEWDDPNLVVAEVQRRDCGGEWQTVHVEQSGVDGCWTDRFMPLSGDNHFCDETNDCEIVYRVRYWGLVTGFTFTTAWTEEPPLQLDNPAPGNAWIRGPQSGDLSICPTEVWARTRPFAAYQPIAGGTPTVVTGAPGGRDYTLTFAARTHADLAALEEILAAPLVFYQPTAQPDLWMAPQADSYTATKVKRITEITCTFVQVEPEPLPTPQSFL